MVRFHGDLYLWGIIWNDFMSGFITIKDRYEEIVAFMLDSECTSPCFNVLNVLENDLQMFDSLDSEEYEICIRTFRDQLNLKFEAMSKIGYT